MSEEDSQEKSRLISEIEVLKRDKPDKWKVLIKRKIGRMWHLDHPDNYQASEMRGRNRVRSMSLPCQEDNYGESSNP